jgi:ankyrin repeat protein
MVEILKLLIKHGAFIEDATSFGLFEGKTAICWASSQGRADAVSLLLQAGANPHKPVDKGVFLGKTALHWAASQGRTEVVRILIAAGVDVNYASTIGNFKGKNALMWASSQGRFETVVLLLEAGTNVNAVDNDGVSALMWASGSEAEEEGHKKGLFEKATKGHIDVVRWLLKYGAEPDLRDNDGITAVMYACYHGHDGAVEVLLNNGADASYENKSGKNALQLASSAGFFAAADAIKRGPTILTLPVEDMVQVSTCGWLVTVLRLPLGTGIFPKNVTKHKNSFTLENSCVTLRKNGLDYSLEDTFSIVDLSSIDDVVNHLGLPNFASVTKSRSQLSILYQKYKNRLSNNSSITVNAT